MTAMCMTQHNFCSLIAVAGSLAGKGEIVKLHVISAVR